MITTAQIEKAKAFRPTMVNLDQLADACDQAGFPFFLGLTILQKETNGRNVYGHDAGGALTDFELEVTEDNYWVFRWLIAAKGMSWNGVGPLQLTYAGFHTGPVSMEAKGLKAWEPADSILYGVRDVLMPAFRAARKTQGDQQAFQTTAVKFNGAAAYGVDALKIAKSWAVQVGTADTLVRWDT